MLKIAICDDDVKFCGVFEKQIELIEEESNLEIYVEVLLDGDELIKTLENGVRYDIVFMDIEMQKINGVDAANKLREFDKYVILIYISSHEEYALELFDSRPFHFMKKPMDWNKFRKIFRQAYEEREGDGTIFEFKVNRSYYKLLLNEILYFESDKRIVNVVTKGNTYSFYGKLNEIEHHLLGKREKFIRTHQSFLVNDKYILNTSPDSVELINGIKLPISDERSRTVRELFSMTMWSKLK